MLKYIKKFDEGNWTSLDYYDVYAGIMRIISESLTYLIDAGYEVNTLALDVGFRLEISGNRKLSEFLPDLQTFYEIFRTKYDIGVNLNRGSRYIVIELDSTINSHKTIFLKRGELLSLDIREDYDLIKDKKLSKISFYLNYNYPD